MKTLIRFSKLLVLPFIVLSALSGCGSNTGSSSSTAAVTYSYVNGTCYSSTGTAVVVSYCTTSTGYYLSNGMCYTTGGVQVATAYCSATTSGYYVANGYCYNSGGVQVSVSYCSATTSTATTSTSYVVQACYGTYYYSSNYGTQLVYCSGSNCRGYIMTSTSTGQPVVCQ